MDWQVYVRYGNTNFILDAEIIYQSNQIMRIKVHGNSSYIILENDYPFLLLKNSNKAINWKIKDKGFLNTDNEKDAALVAHIISNLNYQIKGTGQKHLDRINGLRAKW
jgi:hypothetical protein